MDGTVQSNVDDQPGISGGFNPLALIDPTLTDQQLNDLAGTPGTDTSLAAADESLLSQLGIASGQGGGTIGGSLGIGSVPSWVWIAAVGVVGLALVMRK